MEDYYFIPVLDSNFIRVLSEERISPPSFYFNGNKTGEGFNTHNYFPSHNLFAFSSIYALENYVLDIKYNPKIKKYDSKLKHDPKITFFNLAIPSKYLLNNPGFEFNDGKVLKLSGTVYLNPEDCFFVVPSFNAKRSFLGLAKRSCRETVFNKYINNIFSFEELSLEILPWDSSYSKLLVGDEEVSKESFNKFKRNDFYKKFIYGFCFGLLLKESKNLGLGINKIHEFKDFLYQKVFSQELSRDIEYLSSNGIRGNVVKRRILSKIKELESLKNEVSFYLSDFDDLRIKSILKDKFHIDDNVYEELNLINSTTEGASVISALVYFLKSKGYEYLNIEECLNDIISNLKELCQGDSEKFSFFEYGIDDFFDQINGRIIQKYLDLVWSQIPFKNFPFEVDSDDSIVASDLFFSRKDKLYFDVVIKRMADYIGELKGSWSESTKKNLIEVIFDEISIVSKERFPEDSDQIALLRSYFNTGESFDYNKLDNAVLRVLFSVYNNFYFSYNSDFSFFGFPLDVDLKYIDSFFDSFVYYFPLINLMHGQNYYDGKSMGFFELKHNINNWVESFMFKVYGFDLSIETSNKPSFMKWVKS